MGLKACLFNEDIDLTGGSAAVAAALAAGIRGGFTVDGDSVIAPVSDNMHIVGVLSGTETAAIEGGTLTVTGMARPLSLGGTYVVPLHVFRQLGLWIPIGSGADIDFLGYDHAAAAQEFCSVIVDDPNMPDPWGITPYQSLQSLLGEDGTTISVGIASAARVAATQSGHTDICGRTTAYTDGQAAIANDASIDIYVLDVYVREAAGYSGVGLEAPGNQANLDFPTLATVDSHYNMKEMFGGALRCTGQRPFSIYGYGVGAGAIAETVLVLGVKGL